MIIFNQNKFKGKSKMEGLKESLGEKDMEENQEQSILENEKEENNPKKNKKIKKANKN